MCFIARFTRVAVLCLSLLMLVANARAASSNAVAPSPAPAATMIQIPTAEYIKTYAGDCVTPQTVFYLGDTVCAEAGDYNSPLTSRSRRFSWSAPNGFVADQGAIKSDPEYTRFQIPSTCHFARLGQWQVCTINPDANREVRASFIVRDIWDRFADLTLTKWGPPYVEPGLRVPYRVILTNPGPDFAEYVEVYDEVPNDMTFYALKQVSGPEVTCKTPEIGQTGKSLCVAKGLDVGETIELDFYYIVSRDVREGASFHSTVEAYSRTEDLNKFDNFSTYG